MKSATLAALPLLVIGSKTIFWLFDLDGYDQTTSYLVIIIITTMLYIANINFRRSTASRHWH